MPQTVKERTRKFVDYLGIKMKTFEERCNLSSGYVTSMRKGFGREKLNNVLNVFPELNREWLLFGEGEMLNPTIHQEPNVNNSHKGDSLTTIDKVIDEIAAQRKIVQKSQEQIDRLLSIIENMSNKR